MSYAAVRKLTSLQVLCVLIVASLLAVGLLHIMRAYGDELPVRSLTLSKALPSATDTYQLRFTVPNNETLGSVELQICAEGPLPGPCTSPSGLDMSGVSLSNQTGATGFNVLSATTNTVILTRPATAVAAGTVVTYELQGAVNPSTAGSYFGRVQTYATTNATGNSTDFGGLAYALTNLVQISATVPPYLYFCLGVTITNVDCTTSTGNYLNFGDFSTANASIAEVQMVAGTNADTGYNITVNGTTLTSGNNIITPLTSADTSRPGVSQFGMNLVANNDPQVGQDPSGSGVGQPTSAYNQTNLYKFIDGDTVVTVPAPDEPRKYTTSFIANITHAQPPGVYVSTLTYVATGGF